jgi:hypothetical protein
MDGGSFTHLAITLQAECEVALHESITKLYLKLEAERE